MENQENQLVFEIQHRYLVILLASRKQVSFVWDSGLQPVSQLPLLPLSSDWLLQIYLAVQLNQPDTILQKVLLFYHALIPGHLIGCCLAKTGQLLNQVSILGPIMLPWPQDTKQDSWYTGTTDIFLWKAERWQESSEIVRRLSKNNVSDLRVWVIIFCFMILKIDMFTDACSNRF